MSSADITSEGALKSGRSSLEEATIALPRADEQDEVASGRRPGLVRRWLLRPLIWGVALILIFIFVLQILLDTRYARRWAIEVLTEELGTALERRVEIADISFSLLPLSVELWGLRLDSPEEMESDLPFLEVPWLAIDADLQALQQNVLRLREVRLERPRVYMQFFPGGISNVVRFHRGGGGGPRSAPRRFDVLIDHVEIEQAEVLLDEESIELSLSGDSVRAQMQGLGHLHVGGQITGQEFTLYLPGAEAFKVSASGRISIQNGRVDIEDARISGDDLEAVANGACLWKIGSPRARKCEFELAGKTSGEKLDEVGYFRDLGGEFTVEGTYTWRPQHFGWRSRIMAPRLSIWKRELENVEGELEIDRYQARLFLREASYGGGTVEGAIDLATRQEGRPMLVDLELRDIPLDRLLADQKVRAGPFASKVSGNVVYRFPLRRGRSGSGHGEIRVEADREFPGLEVSGSFPLRIENGVVQVDSAVLSSPLQSTLASGFFDIKNGRGRYEYQIETVDIRPLVHAMQLLSEGDPWPAWLPTEGEGRLNGVLHLERGAASSEVHLQLAKVLGRDLREPHTLRGSFQLGQRGLDDLHLQLARSSSTLSFYGHIPFGGNETGESPGAADEPLELGFDAVDWPLAAVHPWLTFSLPLEGRISGHLDLLVDGTESEGRLERARVTEARLADLHLHNLSGSLDWNEERLRFDRLTALTPAGEIQGEGRLTWLRQKSGESQEKEPMQDGGAILDIDLRTAALAIDKAPLRDYLPRSDLRGEVAMTAKLSGSLEKPQLDVKIQADGIAVGSRVLEARSSELDLRWADGWIEASGRLLDMVTLEGGGALDRHYGALAFGLDGHDVAGLLELLLDAPPDDLDGSFSGTLLVSGGLDREQDIDLELDRLEVDFRSRRLANLEPVTIGLHSDRLEVGSLYLEERATGSEVFLTGDLGVGDGEAVDLRLQGTLSSSWLQLLRPDIRADGTFDLLGRVGGTVDEPFFDGQGAVRASRVVFEGLPDFPHACEDVRGVFLFQQGGVVIDHLKGTLAGGEVRLAGRADMPRRGQPLNFRLQLAGTGLRIRYPDNWLLEGSAELTWRTLEPGAGSLEGLLGASTSGETTGRNGDDVIEQGYLLTGRADLTGIEYSEDIPLSFAEVMQDVLLRQRLEVDSADRVLSAIQLNVEVNGPGALRVRNNLAELSGSVDLLLRGNMSQPIFLGDVELEPGGKLVYSSVDYELDRGNLHFNHPANFDPEVDLRATTRVRDFDVILTLSGTMERLNAGFTSEPPLPALEVFELLATGGDDDLESNPLRRADEIGQDQSMSAASFLYGQAAEVIGKRVSDLFGFDKFRIAPLTGSGDNLSTARVTVGKRLSKDIFLSYSADPASTEEQRLQIEWQVGGGLVLVLTQNGDNSYEADARWERSF